MTGRRGDTPLRRLLARRVDEGWMAGAAWWVEGPRGPVDHGAVGWAARAPRAVALEEATPFDLASLTKPLCTALLLVLLEVEERLDPSRPVAGWLGELDGSWVGRASLLDLASHTAGLEAWRPLYLEASDGPGYLRTIAATRRAVPPGQTLYSDLGYVVLGLVLERATGRGLERLFLERVARPLGLARLGFAVGGRGFEDAAATECGNAHERTMAGEAGARHRWRTEVLRGEVHDGNAHGLGGVAGHAGLFGPLADVAAVGRELLLPQRLPLGPAARRRLFEARSACGGRSVGCVVAAHSRAARGILPDRAPGHTGFTGTSLWLDPTAGIQLVLLTNRVHPAVSPRDFQCVRRAFHRMAYRQARGADSGAPLQ